MKKSLTLLLPMILSLLLPAIAMAAPSSTDSQTAKLLAKAREATAKYHDVSVALADGYVPVGPCVQIPGIGVMGIHYMNFALASDLSVNEFAPEILLYVPYGGGYKLVGAEYFMVAIGTNGTYTGPWFGSELPAGWVWLTAAPTLFGRPMDGPMAPHEPGMPWHYDLHVWLWQGNSEGIFAEFNPTVKC